MKTTLGNIAKINQNTYSKSENWGFVKYLDTGNIIENKIDEIITIDLSLQNLPSRARRKVKRNSIIYSTVRPNQKHFGFITNQPKNFLVSTGFVVIDVDESIADPSYVYYFLTSESTIQTLQTIAEGSTSSYPSIKPSDIEELPIELPPLDTQRKIAKILNLLDIRINKSTEINDNLVA